MVNSKNKGTKNNRFTIRDTLFGDLPISAWTGGDSGDEPWVRFQAVEKSLEAGSTEDAIQILREITATPKLESRHYLQAWHFLQSLGVAPPDEGAKEVYGVVVEVTLEQGLDIVAAYADHTARYFNYSGAGVIWDRPDDSLQGEIQNLLDAGVNIVHQIGPWEGGRPAAPPQGQARVNILTPSGLHFGQAPLNALANDDMGGPIIRAAIDLMQALIKKSGEEPA